MFPAQTRRHGAPRVAGLRWMEHFRRRKFGRSRELPLNLYGRGWGGGGRSWCVEKEEGEKSNLAFSYYILMIMTDVDRNSKDIVTSETGTMIIQFSCRRKMFPSCLILKVFDADHRRSIHYGGMCTRYWPMMLHYCYYWLRSYWSSPASTSTGGAASTIFQDERGDIKAGINVKKFTDISSFYHWFLLSSVIRLNK